MIDERVPFVVDTGSLVVNYVDILILQMPEGLELHGIVECGRCNRTIFPSWHTEGRVWTYLVHFCGTNRCLNVHVLEYHVIS